MSKPMHISEVVDKVMEDLELRKEITLKELQEKFPEEIRSSFMDDFLNGIELK